MAVSLVAALALVAALSPARQGPLDGPVIRPGEVEAKRSVRGRVVHPDGSPIQGALVHLTMGDVPGHDFGQGASVQVRSKHVPGHVLSKDEQLNGVVFVPFRDASASLDAEGAFDLGEHARRPAVVSVCVGKWIRHDEYVDLAALEGPLVVTLPLLGSIAGRVSLPERPPRTAYFLQPARFVDDWTRERFAGARSGALEGDGSYELGPLLVGLQELELVEIEHTGPNSWRGIRTIERVRVDIAPGAPTPYELDLTQARPTGRVMLSVTLAGAPATGWNYVQLTPVERYDASGRERSAAEVRCWTDPSVLPSVSAGAHRLTVTHERLWAYTFPEPVEVVAAGETHITVDVPVVRRIIRVLTAEGEPCASSEVWIGPTVPLPPWERGGSVVGTSAEAEVELALPIGRYPLHLGTRVLFPQDMPPTTELEWSAGESPLVVRLPARDAGH